MQGLQCDKHAAARLDVTKRQGKAIEPAAMQPAGAAPNSSTVAAELPTLHLPPAAGPGVQVHNVEALVSYKADDDLL